MSSRSDEVMRQLNRLMNDRNITPQARNQIRDAVNHIRDLQCQLGEADNETTTELVSN